MPKKIRRPFIKNYILNDRIRAKTVRLIGFEGKQLGVVTIEEARRLSNESDLDLILISEEAVPPVCKLVNFGQFKYEQQKKDKIAKKGNKSHVVKELKLSPKMSENDFQVRVNSGVKFLQKGYKIKLSLFFRGREMAHPELGKNMLNRYIEDIKELGQPESAISVANRAMMVLICPGKSKG